MRRRLGFLIVIGLLFGFLSACGDKEPQRLTAKTLFPHILTAQKKAGQSRFAMSISVPSSPKIQARGQIKMAERPQDMAMSMKMTLPMAGQSMTSDMRILNQNIYMSLGEMTKGKFLKVDLKDPSNPMGKMYGSLMDNLDPTTQMKQYADAVTSFDSSGHPVQLDGVKAQPYTMTIDVTKVKQLAQLDKSGAKMPKSAKLTLYVGPDDLPRRTISTMRIPGTTGRTRFQMDFSRWGDPVSILAPKPSQIMQGDPFNQPAA